MFYVDKGVRPLDGLLLYVESDHAFDFVAGSPQDVHDRCGNSGVTSLTVGTLQIEVGVETGALLFVWGYHPRTTWRDERLDPPSATPGGMRVATVDLEPGVSVQIAPDGAWQTTYDPHSGWVRIASDGPPSGETRVVVARGVIIGSHSERLSSIWLHPVFD